MILLAEVPEDPFPYIPLSEKILEAISLQTLITERPGLRHPSFSLTDCPWPSLCV